MVDEQLLKDQEIDSLVNPEHNQYFPFTDKRHYQNSLIRYNHPLHGLAMKLREERIKAGKVSNFAHIKHWLDVAKETVQEERSHSRSYQPSKY